MTSWLDTHLLIIYASVVIAIWAGIRAMTSSNKSWLVIFGVALGGAGLLIFLRWYNKKLIKDAEEIQKERDIITEKINKKEQELKMVNRNVTLEEEKLQVLIEKEKMALDETEQAGHELQGTIDALNKKYGF